MEERCKTNNPENFTNKMTSPKSLQAKENAAKLKRVHRIVQLMVAGCGFVLFIFLFYSFMASEPQVTKSVFLDIEIDGHPAGQIVIGLFGKVTPKTAKRFLQTADGKAKYSYQGTNFSRAIENFNIQGGEIISQRQDFETVAYGKEFDDENFKINHFKGAVSMANKGRKNSNGSEFFILTRNSAPWLDGKHVVFGKVLKGMNIVKQIEMLPTSTTFELLSKVVIVKCGEVK